MAGKSDQVRAAKAEEKRARVWNFMGDTVHPPGDVNVIGRAGPGERVVRRVDTGEEFVARQAHLERLETDGDDEAGEGEGGDAPPV